MSESRRHPLKIAIIGAGNVATHLSQALAQDNHIVQVLARTPQSARRLADLLNSLPRLTAAGDLIYKTEAITDPAALLPDCDLYLVSVNDDALAEVASRTPDYPGIWAHTSGSVGMEVFAGKKQRYGVFYPLQTFSRDLQVEMREVPMLIEGSDPEVASNLMECAAEISDDVRQMASNHRAALHVAAVFACNFANLMWMEADRLLKEEGMDVKIFRPLLQATLGKLKRMTPEEAMTGPARRGDLDVIHRHLDRLPEDKRRIYELLTREILNTYHPDLHL